jgi:2,4-dienoyl-CoA reductase-like NADH-dependent reductase (Old Yellow Enzyme family)
MALPLAVVRAVQAVLPAHIAFGARINGTDWHDDGLTPDDAVGQAQMLKDAGLHFICVSSGGATPHAKVVAAPKYQVPIAARVKREVGILTRTVGLISDPHVAEAIIADGEADMVALGRAFLDDPRWPWRAAEALGVDGVYPVQYERVAPKYWPLKAR